MSRNTIAVRNAEILRKCSNSERLEFLKESINGNGIYGLEDGMTLKYGLHNYMTNGILTCLTRGQFQDFLLDRSISLATKYRLLANEEFSFRNAEQNPLIESNKEVIAKLFEDEDYGPILMAYDKMMEDELKAADKLVEAYEDAKDILHLEEKVTIDGDDITEYTSNLDMVLDYEMKNLYAILSEPNLAQRNKWLQEITNLESDEELSPYDASEMEENSRRYIYYKLKEATTKKFYESIGIDYEDNGANPMLPENVDFGLELEEIGVKWGVCEVHDFDSTSDITLRDYDRMTMKYLDTETGEYQTSLLSTDYPDDFRKLDEQLDILNYYGAKTNESCGLHIHVSTRYTGEYELDTGDAEIPPEDFDKAKNLQREVYEMQHVIGKAFKMFDDRRKETCSYLSTPEYDDLQLEKFQFVNMETLDDGTGIEFRFLNLPFALDKKVIDAYVDFVTSYMLYIDEGNNTMEYVEEAIEETGIEPETTFEENELKLEILKQQLCLKDSTMKVLDHIDEIYEFHNVGCVEIVGNEYMDYYTKYNKPIVEETCEEETEEEIWEQ